MDAELQGFLTGFHSAVDALELRILELKSRDYPTALSKKLLRVFRAAICESAQIVDALSQDGDADRKSIMRHGHLLSWVHGSVHLVSCSLGSEVPRWAIQPMRFEIGKYLKESVDIMIVGGEEGGNFAYDYRLDRLAPVLAAALGSEVATAIQSELPKHMAVFHFPFGERDNVLAHGAFYHEVGHQIDLVIRGISHRTYTQFSKDEDGRIRDIVRDNMKKSLQTLDEQGAEVLREVFVKLIQSTLHCWSMEFCADLIATRILGPAYPLVVVHSPMLLSNLTLHSQSHPATLFRLKLILDLLSETGRANDGQGDFFTQVKNSMAIAGIQSLLGTWKERGDTADYQAMGWLDDTIPQQLRVGTVTLAEELSKQILEAVEKETRDQEYTPEQFNRDIVEVSPELEAGITINEHLDPDAKSREPNNISTIFNVGWACFLGDESRDGRERLRRLLRKSIELSQIQTVLK